MKQTKFIVHVKADLLYEAHIRADTMAEALEKALKMKHEELYWLPGSLIDDEVKIVGIFQ